MLLISLKITKIYCFSQDNPPFLSVFLCSSCELTALFRPITGFWSHFATGGEGKVRKRKREKGRKDSMKGDRI